MVTVSPVGAYRSQRSPTRSSGSVAPSLASSVAVPSGSYRIILAMPPPKCRRTSRVAAANTTSGGSPRATSVARRRSAAWVSASSRSSCSARALAIAVAASSMKSAIRDSVPAGKSSCEVAATVTPQRRPPTTMGVATPARMPSVPTQAPCGPLANCSPLTLAGSPVRSAAA